MDVIAQRGEVTALGGIYDDGLVAALEEMPVDVVAAVEAHSAGGLEPAHPGDEVGLRSFDEEMVVIAHEHKGMHQPARAPAPFTQSLEEPLAIPVVAENRFAAVATIQHMIECSGGFDTGFARHATGLPQAALFVHPGARFTD